METLTRLPQTETETHETLRHFDVLSSVDLMRFDLQTEGEIRQETLQRVYDEELSLIAEGINRPACTTFTLQERGGQLSYFHNGQWTPYRLTLEKGKRAAYQARANDFRKQILVDMAEQDLKMYDRFASLSPGDRVVWHSAFNDDYHRRYGTKFMHELGFQAHRRMGFLYEASKNQDGSLTMKTQSVDNSNEAGFAASMQAAEDGAMFHEVLAVYDTTLEEQTGKMHYAGRPAEGGQEQDAWEFIRQNSDLIQFFMQGIKELAKDVTLPRHELEWSKKKLTYGVWAAIRIRLDRSSPDGVLAWIPPGHVSQEVNQAYRQLQALGETMFGCGGSISAEDLLMNANVGDVFDATFGNNSEGKDSWSWKAGICRVSECPTRPGKTKVGPCSVCQLCQRHFDKGRDPNKVYSARRANAALN